MPVRTVRYEHAGMRSCQTNETKRVAPDTDIPHRQLHFEPRDGWTGLQIGGPPCFAVPRTIDGPTTIVKAKVSRKTAAETSVRRDGEGPLVFRRIGAARYPAGPAERCRERAAAAFFERPGRSWRSRADRKKGDAARCCSARQAEGIATGKSPARTQRVKKTAEVLR